MNGLLLACALLGAASCSSGSEGAAKPGGSAAAASSATGGTPAGGAVSAASIEIAWTRKWKPGDAPGSEHPVYTVKNKASAPLTYMQIWHYFYDKDGKQVGRTFTERYQMSIAPGATEEIAAGPMKTELPPGTERIEAVVIGANFGSEAVKFRDAPPPEQRPSSGH